MCNMGKVLAVRSKQVKRGKFSYSVPRKRQYTYLHEEEKLKT